MRSAVVAVALSLLSTGFTSNAFAAEGWNPLDQREGVELWQRPEPGYTVATFRSRSIIHAPIAQLSAIVWDTQRGCEWMADCVESKLLEARGKDVTIQYSRSHTSVWLPDRDVVLEKQLAMVPQAKSVRLNFHSIDDSRSPNPRWVVRIARLEGFILLKQVDAGTTEVVYQTTIDPGGGVTTTLMREPALTMLVNVHRSLRLQAEKPGYDTEVAQLRRDFDWSAFTLSTAPTGGPVDAAR